ncbi:hypothetical protein [Yinghuangia seranimata]|uniref:hypothetical protein n=1 Tax=Yinghuangia seranimata TaxID=408067 RepID=UPI00248B4DB5|nr:hypothetical protein [Yinghuangia seranimata]MDI2128297.1 hypothetical protein [Yinghuangia seranimata]
MTESKRPAEQQPAPPGVTEVMRRRAFPANQRPQDSDDAARLLRIYLSDHFAGATSGVSLARRIARNHKGGAYGLGLAEFAKEVAEDRETLRRVMDDLGCSPVPAKFALAWAMTQAGGLKPNGRLLGRSPLSAVIELETMRMGVEGKASMWRGLRALADDDHRLSAEELGELVERAEAQSKRLEEIRVGIMGATFGPGGGDGQEARVTEWKAETSDDRRPADSGQ